MIPQPHHLLVDDVYRDLNNTYCMRPAITTSIEAIYILLGKSDQTKQHDTEKKEYMWLHLSFLVTHCLHTRLSFIMVCIPEFLILVIFVVSHEVCIPEQSYTNTCCIPDWEKLFSFFARAEIFLEKFVVFLGYLRYTISLVIDMNQCRYESMQHFWG